jgi:hypothetical protein
MVAASLAAAACYFSWWPLDHRLGRGEPAQVVSVGTGIVVATVVYLAAARVLGIREMQALLSLRGRRARP